ncbi:hypothetical protein WJX82_009681 [Trebouxia sp. C0006]
MLSLSSSAIVSGTGTCSRSAHCSVSSQRPVQGLLLHRSSNHLNSCHSSFRTFLGASASKTRRRITSTPATNATDLPLIQSEEDFAQALTQNKVLVVDWMARWCRKCIYLKPKIQKMMEEEFPDLPIVYVDVNAVPGQLVYGNGIKKMPTIALYQNQEKVAEHIAAEGGKDAVGKIKAMIETNLKTPELVQDTAS